MQDQRIGSQPSQQTQHIERAILALLLADDHPWRLDELQKALGDPLGLVRICVARLRADGLVDCNGRTARASWAVVRSDELRKP
jgi:DNA-binding GntR family transcriptional regulator